MSFTVRKFILLMLKLESGRQNLTQKITKPKIFLKRLLILKTGKIVIKLGDKINYLTAKKLASDGLKDIFVSQESLYGKYLHRDVKVSDDEEEGTFGNRY